MPQFTYDLDNDLCEEFASAFGWTPTVKDDAGHDIPHPIPVVDFCEDKISSFIKGNIVGARAAKAAELAKKQVEDSSDIDI